MNQFSQSHTNKLNAISKGEKVYSGSPCKNCFSLIKSTSHSGCVKCHTERNKHKLYDGTINKYHTKENGAKRMKTWRTANPLKVKEQRNRVRPYQAEYQSKRRGTVRQQTPPNADAKLIQEKYIQAADISKSTGIPHEVDHIIPISRGGPHHQDNLRVITRTENRIKGGRI